MQTKQITPIIEEFSGKKCILRLTSGQIISGIIGEMLNNSLTCVREVTIGNDKKTDIYIPLMEIDALCLA